LVVVVLGSVVLIGLRVRNQAESQKSKNNNIESASEAQPTQVTSDTKSLELKNLGIDVAQDVDFNKYATAEFTSLGMKGFYLFGDKLGGKTQTQLNPNFEFSSVKKDTLVVAAIDGIVAFIKEQPDSGDKEVFLQPVENSPWVVGYDHLSDVSVTKGQAIKAGDTLGKPTIQGNGLYRFEIQINKEEDGETTFYCPTSLLASEVRDKIVEQLSTMQDTWESTTGLELYDSTAQKPVGCLLETMNVAQSEGR
jgi:murein DD-endopeptidase MepM/ murein hydrolase activator NlpD